MKKLISALLSIIIVLNMIIAFGLPAYAEGGSAHFSISTADSTDKQIGNIVGYMNSWGYENLRNLQTDGETDLSFVDYIEIMTATGGSEERDLIDANGNMIPSKLNALAEACQGILNLGAKPLLKLGCIPFYFSMKANPNKEIGEVFGYNPFPPDADRYYEYQLYLENVIQYMIDRFGIDEVRSWRFGVMTEYENDEWFYVLNSKGKIDTGATMEAFFKIYDYSVLALENKLGAENVFVGAHSMTVTEGCWDERNFIDHAANGYNYAKGTNTGAQLDYLSFSFYDYKPEQYTSGMTLSQCVNFLRSYAVSKGFTNLKYGIDEGRILGGVNSGKGGDALNTRCVGHMWQAGYDARMFKTMLDNDIDYFCFWSLSSDSIGKGYPTISHHVTNCVSKMVDENGNVVSTYLNYSFYSVAERSLTPVYGETLTADDYISSKVAGVRDNLDGTYTILVEHSASQKVTINGHGVLFTYDGNKTGNLVLDSNDDDIYNPVAAATASTRTGLFEVKIEPQGADNIFVKPYVINSSGETVYGEDASFALDSALTSQSVNVLSVTEITLDEESEEPATDETTATDESVQPDYQLTIWEKIVAFILGIWKYIMSIFSF